MTTEANKDSRHHAVSFKTVVIEINIQTRECYKAPTLPLRIFWIFFLLVSVASFTGDVYLSLRHYLISQTVTSFGDTIYEQLPFPAGWFCIRAPLNETMLKEKGLPPRFIPYILKVFDVNIADKYTDAVLAKISQDFRKWRESNPHFNLGLFVMNSRINSMGIFKSCQHQHDVASCHSYRAPDEDFLDYKGICYALDNKDNNQTTTGFAGRFRIEIERNISEIHKYLPGHTGHIDLILRPQESHMDTLAYDPILIYPGHKVEVSITRTISTHIRDCRPSDWNAEAGTYELCRRACERDANLRLFNCSVPGTILYPTEPNTLCDPGPVSTLAHMQLNSIECDLCIDVPPCKVLNLKPAVQGIVVPGLKENQAVVDVYYAHFDAVMMEETPATTLAAFMGALGGQASLWLNVRVATFAQLTFYGGRYIHDRWMGKSQSRPTRTSCVQQF